MCLWSSQCPHDNSTKNRVCYNQYDKGLNALGTKLDWKWEVKWQSENWKSKIALMITYHRQEHIWFPLSLVLTITSIDNKKNGAQSMNADDGDGWRNGAKKIPANPDGDREWMARCSETHEPVNTSVSTVNANSDKNPRLMASLVLNCCKPSLPKKSESAIAKCVNVDSFNLASRPSSWEWIPSFLGSIWQ